MIPLAIGVYSAAIVLAPSMAWRAVLCAPLVLVPLVLRTVFNQKAWILLFFAAALLLPPLPVALGDSGPHPALLLAALGMCAGLVRLREWNFRFDALSLAAIALFSVLIASVALAAIYSDYVVAFGSLARVLLFGISVYTFLYVANGPAHYTSAEIRRATRLLFLFGCASALFGCLDFYYQFPAPAGYGAQFVWLDNAVLRRAQGLFYEASTFGNLCAFFIVMVCVGLFRRDSWVPFARKWLAAGGVLFLGGLILSYSRASVLNIIVALAAYAYIQRLKIRRVLLIAAGSAGAAVALVMAVFPNFALSYWLRLSTSVQFFAASPEGVLSGRVGSWRILVDFLLHNPWHAILGVGYKTLPYSSFIGRPVVGDNMYLSLLVETGVVGLGAFCAFNLAALVFARRAAASADPQTAFFGKWIFCFWMGEVVQMATGDLLTYWRVLPLYLWVLAIAVTNARSVSRSI
ncbi:MAG TPA: O-antigen ligase family protein [Bryobacteraceae bacterium]|nr:O-antigen ligase family protein [Bryobacteraceae bacterium]